MSARTSLRTYVGAQWLVRPLASLSESIRNLRPGRRGQHVTIQTSDPEEVAAIAGALNEYLRGVDRFVERERAFLTLVSHELRTPIAVIRGAAEIALQKPMPRETQRHVFRILATARNIEDLVALLLVLARDPARLMSSAVRLDLANVVRHIVADHEHLLLGKELSFAYGAMPCTEVLVPEPVARAAIGNLVRNAVENSSRGEISISIVGHGTLAIENPGDRMAADELNRLQARLARTGVGHGDGIGLALVARLCDHLGWTLAFEPGRVGGAVAKLSFSGSR